MNSNVNQICAKKLHGRETAINDCPWMDQLGRFWLSWASFVNPPNSVTPTSCWVSTKR
jgi:hypothetical protein